MQQPGALLAGGCSPNTSSLERMQVRLISTHGWLPALRRAADPSPSRLAAQHRSRHQAPRLLLCGQVGSKLNCCSPARAHLVFGQGQQRGDHHLHPQTSAVSWVVECNEWRATDEGSPQQRSAATSLAPEASNMGSTGGSSSRRSSIWRAAVGASRTAVAARRQQSVPGRHSTHRDLVPVQGRQLVRQALAAACRAKQA